MIKLYDLTTGKIIAELDLEFDKALELLKKEGKLGLVLIH